RKEETEEGTVIIENVAVRQAARRPTPDHVHVLRFVGMPMEGMDIENAKHQGDGGNGAYGKPFEFAKISTGGMGAGEVLTGANGVVSNCKNIHETVLPSSTVSDEG